MIAWRLGARAAQILERLEEEHPRYAKLDVLPEDGARVLAAYDRRCAYCQASGDVGNEVGIDLLVPERRGGTNHPENLVAACDRCRATRGGRHLDVFLEGRLEFDARSVYARVARATARLRAGAACSRRVS
jgi:5-methylcytosine-specific restriction endonuclease McrA